ncbi:U-box domain-containing protein 9-like [Rutidosis leptorrhynchoides]|uniref:U-box domain-containing protein 9-like n=1 Tax=Rutidosis leptorrhynchoides TaxID=125765 RepID=UPI003A9992FD
MAKSEVFEGDQSIAVAKVMMELKKELQKLVKLIVEDSSSLADENGFELIVDKANQTLLKLKDLKEGNSKQRSKRINDNNSNRRNHNNNNNESSTTSFCGSCPPEFCCPLSKELMRDPVILSTGQTYDRPYIQKWLKAGNRICPNTQQVLSHTILTPNHLVRDLITQWCKNLGVQFPTHLQYSDQDELTEADRDLFISLLKKMSSTQCEQKEAARTLRSLTKRMPSFRALFGENLEAIPQLLTPLCQNNCDNDIHPDLQEDLITTLLNLSIHDNNKKLVAEIPMVMPLLLDALRYGTIETRTNAAATLFTLSALDSNKSLIGKAGGLKPLIDLLDEGHPLSMKDVASAIFNLCITHENKARAVRDGAVRTLLHKIKNRVHVDELLSILAMLSTNQKAVEEMGDLGAVSCLLCLIKETNCARNKENCIAVLYTICYYDRTKWKEMREEESTYGTLSQVAQNGTSRAKRKANGILDRLNRAINLTHTA